MSKIILPGWTQIIDGGTPQPIFGTLLAQAVSPSVNGAQQTVNVNTTLTANMLSQDDKVYIDTGANAELVHLYGVGNNTITAIFSKSHASGVAVTLWQHISNFFVQGKEGNSGQIFPFFAPNQFMVLQSYGRNSLQPSKSTGSCLLFLVEKTAAGVQPYYGQAANNYGGNPDNTCFLWIDGTTSDSFIAWADET